MIAERRVLPLGGWADDDARGARPRAGDRAAVHQARRRRPTGTSASGAREIASDQVAERIGGRSQRRAGPRAAGHHRPRARRDPGRARGHREGCRDRRRRQGRAAHRASDAGCRRVLVDGRASRPGQPGARPADAQLDALVSRVERGQLNVDARHDDLLRRGRDGRHRPARPAHRDRGAHRSEARRDRRRRAAALDRRRRHVRPAHRRSRPARELSDVRRTLDPAEQRAWADLRAGRSDRAMAHYHSRGQLHMADTRDQAVEHAVQNWAKLTETPPDRRGRVDLRRLQPGDPPAQRPRTALPRTNAASSATWKSRCRASTTASAKATG